MSTELTPAPANYQRLLGRISEVCTAGPVRAHQAVNTHMTETYWQIGHDIVEFEQGGKIRAGYGKALLTKLSRDLSLRHGKGFSRSNVIFMRLLYLHYAKGQKPSDLLSWSHHVELLRIDDPLERSFYEKQAILEKWSIPELKRQKKTSLFLRLAAGKDRAAILRLASQGQIVAQPADLLRDPFVFEFLKIPEPHSVSETDREELRRELELTLQEAARGRQRNMTTPLHAIPVPQLVEEVDEHVKRMGAKPRASRRRSRSATAPPSSWSSPSAYA